ncbi:MAG: hypothetical protein HY360_09015 [Verrucomicrobia bacterium]|nr:hypothetical protein [Verrucomicrobiota bacterium]
MALRASRSKFHGIRAHPRFVALGGTLTGYVFVEDRATIGGLTAVHLNKAGRERNGIVEGTQKHLQTAIKLLWCTRPLVVQFINTATYG